MLARMHSALVPLSADTAERRAAYAVGAVEVFNSQNASAGRIIELISPVSVNTPDLILP